MALTRKPNSIISADIILPPNVDPRDAAEDLQLILERYFMGGPITRWIRTKRGTHAKRVVSISAWFNVD